MDTSLNLIEACERAGMANDQAFGAILNNASQLLMLLNDLVRAREYAERLHAFYSNLFGPEHSQTKDVEKLLKNIHELERKNPDYRAGISDSRLCSNCNKVSFVFVCGS